MLKKKYSRVIGNTALLIILFTILKLLNITYWSWVWGFLYVGIYALINLLPVIINVGE